MQQINAQRKKRSLKVYRKAISSLLKSNKGFCHIRRRHTTTSDLFNADSKSNSKKQNPILKNVQIWADEHVSIMPLSYKSSWALNFIDTSGRTHHLHCHHPRIQLTTQKFFNKDISFNEVCQTKEPNY